LRLVIAEKPSMGRTIAAAVGAEHKRQGYMEGNGFLVSWCFGHLYELADPEQYWDPQYQHGQKVSWENRWSIFPSTPTAGIFQYMQKPGVDEQLRLLKDLLNRPDVTTIYNAGDADREGEVIVRLVIDSNLESEKKILRLWLQSLTEESIREAFHEAKPEPEYDRLYTAGKTRAWVDWLMGIELTRLCSVKTGSFIRIGRCVCPIVEQIVQREKEIRDFVPQQYWSIVSKTEKDGIPIELSSKKRFSQDEKDQAEALAEKYNRDGAKVTSVKRSKTELKPGKLFSMSDLQSYACKKDKKLSPSEVLDTVQDLYEAGYVTYPRTNSNYLTKAEEEKVAKVLQAFRGVGISDLETKKGQKSIYDDSKVESHSAIIPTPKLAKKDNLDPKKLEIYNMIVRRFLAVFCSEKCKADKTDVTVECGGETFHLKGTVIVEKGWMKYEPGTQKDKELPPLEKGEEIPVDFHPAEKTTKPPKRYTVATLNAWMKAPMKNMKKNSEEEDSEDAQEELLSDQYTDAEWKDILSEATICTEATRADTIDRCIQSNYIYLKKGVYGALEPGFFLSDIMKQMEIGLDAKSTVDLSRRMHDIIKGTQSPADVLEETKTMLDRIFQSDRTVRSPYSLSVAAERGGKKAVGICPRCGKPVYEWPKVYSCSGSGCEFALWKNSKLFDSLKIELTRERAEELLKNGKVYIEGMYSQKTGNTFDAYLVLDDHGDKYVNYKFSFDKKQ